jgi:hypothetical protein
MQAEAFEITLSVGARADVYVDCPEEALPWPLIEALDARQVRAVGPPLHRDGGPGREPESWLRGCAGLVCVSPMSGLGNVARMQALPMLILADATPSSVKQFIDDVLRTRCPRRAYAFYIGRLERDFSQARDAIRTAVEGTAGMDFLWIDDGRHLTTVDGVRERTRRLIEHAEFVVADLTLGSESPRQENPSRAHEIGLALAYKRPLFLSSQEPRRYPYFSVADLQMVFWQCEDELHEALRAWVNARVHLLARRVLNFALSTPRLAEPTFRYDAAARYIGPNLAAQQRA